MMWAPLGGCFLVLVGDFGVSWEWKSLWNRRFLSGGREQRSRHKAGLFRALTELGYKSGGLVRGESSTSPFYLYPNFKRRMATMGGSFPCSFRGGACSSKGCGYLSPTSSVGNWENLPSSRGLWGYREA